MSRRPNTTRRLTEGGSFPFVSALHQKSGRSPLLVGIIVVGTLIVLGYLYHGSGGSSADIAALSKYYGLEGYFSLAFSEGHIVFLGFSSYIKKNAIGVQNGGVSCTQEFPTIIPILKKTYGDSMRKVLHVGPETCSVVTQILEEGDTEAWGLEPYELDDADGNCKSLVQKGIVRVADIKFPLPYRPKSFSLVIVSDAMDYLSPRYLNRTVPELARVSADGLVVLSGNPGHRKVKVAELSKFGRPAKYRTSAWWIRFFIQTSLEQNESASKKFEQAAAKKSYMPGCQIFHLKSLH